MGRILTFENSLGAVASFELPDLWSQAAAEPDVGGRQLRRFFLSFLPDVRFCSYFRTVPLSNPGAEVFQSALYSELHKLDSYELYQLEEVIEAMADDLAFEVLDASTGYLNGFRCLRIRGAWLAVDQLTDCVFLDVNGDGQFVQQLYFAAPSSLYKQHKPEGEAIFKSINWIAR